MPPPIQKVGDMSRCVPYDGRRDLWLQWFGIKSVFEVGTDFWHQFLSGDVHGDVLVNQSLIWLQLPMVQIMQRSRIKQMNQSRPRTVQWRHCTPASVDDSNLLLLLARAIILRLLPGFLRGRCPRGAHLPRRRSPLSFASAVPSASPSKARSCWKSNLQTCEHSITGLSHCDSGWLSHFEYRLRPEHKISISFGIFSGDSHIWQKYDLMRRIYYDLVRPIDHFVGVLSFWTTL